MKKQLIILLITVFISRYNAYSQESVSVDKWKEYIEDLAEESANESQLEALYTELSYLSEHPMDLNQVTAPFAVPDRPTNRTADCLSEEIRGNGFYL